MNYQPPSTIGGQATRQPNHSIPLIPLFAASIIVAVSLTALSSLYVRPSDEIVNWCDEGCLEPRLTAGYPFGYLYDNVGVSIEGSVHWIEDEFRWQPFLANAALYGVLTGLPLTPILAAIARPKRD